MAISIYKDANNGLLMLDGATIPSGGLTIKADQETGWVIIKVISDYLGLHGSTYEGLYSDFLTQYDNPYTSIDELLSSCSDFFVKAPLDGAKWKTYKALLTKLVGEEPIARVLNQDEQDYLDITWSLLEDGIISDIPYDENNTLINIYSFFNDNDEYKCMKAFLYDSRLLISFQDWQLNPTDVINFPIEIKVRQRGTAPILLKAETDIYGDKVLLTFNKKMNPYGLNVPEIRSLHIFSVLYEESIDATNGIVTNNIIEVIPGDAPCLYGDTMTLGYSVDVPQPTNIESFDYGLLQPFEDFPIINNVVEPVEIVSAETNIDGTELLITFSKNISEFSKDGGSIIGQGYFINNIDLGAYISSVDQNIITCTVVDGNFIPENVIAITLDNGLSRIKATDNGLLESFSDFSVTNNVPA